MKKDIHMPPRDTEDRRDVLAALLLEEPQHDDGPLGLAELLDASSKANVLLGGSQQLLGRCAARRRLDALDRAMRTGDVVPSPPVPSGVSSDRHDVGRP